MGKAIRIIGIDPGLRQTGWGIIESLGNQLRFIGAGTIFSDAGEDVATRLCQLHKGLMEVLEASQPHEASVEQVFINKNPSTSLKLGEARGIALLSPALKNIPVFEYAPNRVKKTVIGVGHGDKQQIHRMVKTLLPKAQFNSNDAADALALAICHAHSRLAFSLQRRIIG